ncbi:Signal peptide peptidase-like 1 [Asimina triloba]
MAQAKRSLIIYDLAKVDLHGPGVTCVHVKAIPGMLLALVLCFDNRRSRDLASSGETSSPKGHKYVWYAVTGYAVGLVAALAAGILTRSPQPALLYLVPSTLGPVIFIAWTRKELEELWDGNPTGEKPRMVDV